MKVYEQHHQEQTMSKDHLSFSYLYATKVFLFDHLGFVLQIQSQTFGFMQGSANTMVFTGFFLKKEWNYIYCGGNWVRIGFAYLLLVGICL